MTRTNLTAASFCNDSTRSKAILPFTGVIPLDEARKDKDFFNNVNYFTCT
jgi:hypothetical protein